jgi:molybdenum cofactor biosynthesis protein B
LKPYEQHRHLAREKVGFYVVTVSSSRYEMSESGKKFTDESGDVAEKLIRKRGHKIVVRELVSDDAGQIEGALEKGLKTKNVGVVLFTGGTGVSPTDVTIETVKPHLEKEIEGFGELLRAVSYDKIGFPGVLSRATAGIARGKLLLCLPGSPDGVKTALKLFMEDIPHVVNVAAGRH